MGAVRKGIDMWLCGDLQRCMFGDEDPRIRKSMR